jgi:hypothetical protein
MMLLGVLMSDLATADIRVATFNVSMEAENYVPRGTEVNGGEMFAHLATGEHPQIRNTAEIIQHVRPDILLLNEFDYHPDPEKGIQAFVRNYLSQSQSGAEPIDYHYFYIAPVNTGVDSGHDLDNDGVASGSGADAFGFGLYPGQYGMALLSRFPIHKDKVRTFQHFLWKDMPDNLMSTVMDEQGRAWFSPAAQQVLRLSSKSHWDIPVDVQGETVHILASHPTPPVFDGPEDRNGKRNHDEVRFWVDYLSGPEQGRYIYDDQGGKGGFKGQRFVILGDLNASQTEGDAYKEPIVNLLTHPEVNGGFVPKSEGGARHSPDNPLGAIHTAAWRMRPDYVLPSEAGWKVLDGGVFWPTSDEPLYRLVKDRNASSDHRLVWLDLVLEK